MLGAERHLDGHQKRVDSSVALEIQTAYFQHGAMHTAPEYLDHCGHFKKERGEHTACAVENPDDRCPAWSNR